MPKPNYTVRLQWLHDGPKMVQKCETEQEAKMTLVDWINRFAGIKAVTLTDTEGTHFYNALGKYLFTVPA